MSLNLSTLPPYSSVEGLDEHLQGVFGGYKYSLTVEDLCGVIERYAGNIEVEYQDNAATRYTDDAVQVTLFGCSGSDRSWQAYTGLYRFKSDAMKREYRAKYADFAKVLDSLGAPSDCVPVFRNTNSGTRWDADYRHRERVMSASSLREKLVRRRESLLRNG